MTHPQIKIVHSMDTLFAAEFDANTNVILFPRRLKGDFDGAARAIHRSRGMWVPDLADIQALVEDHAEGDVKVALRQIEADMRALAAADARKPSVFANDSKEMKDVNTRRFHEDNDKTGPIGRVLCCYTVGATQWLAEGDAVHVVNDYYKPRDGALIHSFALGDIWRHASRNNVPAAQPLIHRAPVEDFSGIRLTMGI